MKTLSQLDLVEASGLEYLRLVTHLLQSARLNSSTGGAWEAADFQWWWRRDQHEDPRGQYFWVDQDGPAAAVVLTNWGERWQCDLICAEDITSSHASVLWSQALEQIRAIDARPLEVVIRADDKALLDVVKRSGFTVEGEPGINSWMNANERPSVTPLPTGFTLVSRSDYSELPHPMIPRSGMDVSARLAECSLYDPKLDLAIYTVSGDVAAYALFWADPITGVGLIEPVRTIDNYQRRGLALHLIAVGLELMANEGCTRFKVGSGHDLYLRAGFHPTTEILTLVPSD